MSQVNNFKAMVGSNHTCDLMISYDGTLLTTFFGQDVDDVPAGMSIYEYVNQVSRQDYGMTLLDQLGFDNTYAIGVPQALAEEYGLETISDLIPIAEEVERRLMNCEKNITVAVMGCVVNGPGEATAADVGIAGGKGEGLLFAKGTVLRKVPEDQLVDALFEEIDKL